MTNQPEEKTKKSGSKFFLGAVLGTIVGTIAGIALAPKEQREAFKAEKELEKKTTELKKEAKKRNIE